MTIMVPLGIKLNRQSRKLKYGGSSDECMSIYSLNLKIDYSYGRFAKPEVLCRCSL